MGVRGALPRPASLFEPLTELPQTHPGEADPQASGERATTTAVLPARGTGKERGRTAAGGGGDLASSCAQALRGAREGVGAKQGTHWRPTEVPDRLDRRTLKARPT